jgi:hypothetical protein
MLQLPEVLPPSEPVSPVYAAVNRCMAAYKQAYRAAGTMGADQLNRHVAGSDAYRLALPLTQTETDIQAFISCVTRGIALGVFETHEPSQLLYAAQIALSVTKRKPGKA